MLHDGWILQYYDQEYFDDCRYTFERIPNEKQQSLLYKIDFRLFEDKKSFEAYKDIFKDAGWTLLSKNEEYVKHILYTDSTNPRKEIFSDQASYQELEKRREKLDLHNKYLVLATVGIALTPLSGFMDYPYLSGIIIGVALSLLAFSSYKMLRNEKEKGKTVTEMEDYK